MKIVSDASPLIALAKINQFDLLPRLFGSIIITPEVYAEVVVAGAGLAGAEETSKASWIEVQHIRNPVDLSAARTRFALGIGELSTLVLAKAVQANLILIDDLEARRLALAEGLKPQGTVGILEACFARGYLADLQQAFRDLLTQGIYLNRAFLNSRLQLFNLPPL